MKTEIIEHAYPDSNRIGRFNVMFEVLQDGRERPMLQALFGLCVIFHMEDHESGRGKTYFAASELFEPLQEGAEIPSYRIEVAHPDLEFKNPEHEQSCLKSNGYRFKAIRRNILRVPPAQHSARARLPGQQSH